jgi:hypothetical protein
MLFVEKDDCSIPRIFGRGMQFTFEDKKNDHLLNTGSFFLRYEDQRILQLLPPIGHHEHAKGGHYPQQNKEKQPIVRSLAKDIR